MDASGFAPTKIAEAEKALLEDFFALESIAPREPGPAALDAYIASERESSFHELLWHFIRRDGRNEPEIYRAAGINRVKFCRIRSNADYKPDKVTAVSLAIALRLNLDDTEKLLGAAGLALSHSNKFDLIIRFYLKDGDADPFRINNALHTYDQPLVCGV